MYKRWFLVNALDESIFHSVCQQAAFDLSIDIFIQNKGGIKQGPEPWMTVFNPHKWRKPLNSKQPCDYFRNFNTVITANVFFIPLQFTKTMDPGCKQYSQLDKDFWPLRNSAHHVHRDTVGETKPSFLYDRGCTPTKGTKRRKNYTDKKEKRNHQ